MNYNGKIDFKKFKNSALVDLKGKTATKRCICRRQTTVRKYAYYLPECPERKI